MPTATRLFIPQDLIAEATFALDPDQAHYLSRVLRLSAGARLKLFNGREGEWLAEIVDIAKSRATVRLLERLRPQTSSGAGPWLVFAPVKKSQTDFIVEKATELGAARLIPLLTDRTQSDRVRTDRLRATAKEAAEQCERLDLPEVMEPVRLDQLLANWPSGRALFVCAEAGPARPLRAALTEFRGLAAFVTGPEGGFSAPELDLMQASPLVHAVGLGPRILRAETAALTALAVYQAIAGDGAERPPPRG